MLEKASSKWHYVLFYKYVKFFSLQEKKKKDNLAFIAQETETLETEMLVSLGCFLTSFLNTRRSTANL